MVANADTTVDILLLASSWLNVALYTMELVLCRRYFQRPNRPFFYKLGVSAMLFFDTVCTLTICVNLCIVVLKIGGDPVALLAPTSLAIFMTYCTAAVEQAILCHLFFSLTKNMLVTVFLGLLILVHMGLAFASGALILVLDSVVTAALNTTTASAVTCAAVDIFIAIALGSRVWKLSIDVLPSRNSLARRFFLLSISAGLIVASNTLVMMALLLRHSPAFSFFFSCQGRVYSITLLANFLVGIYFRRGATTAMTTTTPSEQHTSRVAGVEFDVVDGYDTGSPSQNALPSGVMESIRSKSSSPSSPQAVPYNYNLDAEWMQLEHLPSPGVRLEP